MKTNGQTKQFYGIAEGGTCKVGQDYNGPQNSPRKIAAINAARDIYSQRNPVVLRLDAISKFNAKAILELNWPEISQAYAQTHRGQQLTDADHAAMNDAIDNAIFLDGTNAALTSEACGHNGRDAIGCTSVDNAGISQIIIDEGVAEIEGNRRSTDLEHMRVGGLVHESVHAATQQNNFLSEVGKDEDHDTTNKISGVGGVPTRQCGMDSQEDSCSCGVGQDLVGKLDSCFSTRNSAAPGNLREAAARRGPITDPADEVGSSGSGNLPGIELSCVSGNRASGVPRIGCEAAIQCPGGSYAAGLGGASCSCRAVGYREGLSGNVRLPGGEQCPSGLCPGLQNPAGQATYDEEGRCMANCHEPDVIRPIIDSHTGICISNCPRGPPGPPGG